MRFEHFVAAALLSASLAAHADTVQIFAANGTMDLWDTYGNVIGEAQMGGTVTIDTTKGTITNSALTMGGSDPTTFNDVNSQHSYGSGPSSYDPVFDSSADRKTELNMVFEPSLIGFTGGTVTAYFYSPSSQTYLGEDDDLTFSVYIPPASDTPEPTSVLLLGTGLFGIAGLARRRLA